MSDAIPVVPSGSTFNDEMVTALPDSVITTSELGDTAKSIRNDFPAGGSADTTHYTTIPKVIALQDSLDDKLNRSEYSPGGGSSKEYASFYLTTGGVTGVAATATTLVINNTGVNSDVAVFSLASNEVTVNKTGTFLISVNVYFNTSGSSRSEYSKWLEVDTGGGYAEVAGSRFVSYQRGYDSGQSASLTLMLDVTSGDKFRLRVQRTDGGATTGYQDANGTRFTILEL